MNKKRKFDETDGFDEKVKQGLVSLFLQLVPKTKGEISVAGCSNTISVTVHCGPQERISTQRIRECAQQSGFQLCDCSVSFGDKTSKVVLQLGAGENKTKFDEAPKQEYLSRGITEDELRFDHIKHYAKGYLGKQSPPESRMQIEIFEANTKKPWTAECKAVEIRITGWEVCNLAQLENFQHMFPCHVEPVQFDNKTVYVTVRTKLHPFFRTFGLKF
jgi:hypothetical protein